MLVKLGVDISRLEFHTRRSLRDVEVTFDNANAPEPIISSTYEGNHSVISLHYQNRAYDLRLPFKYLSNNKDLVKQLKANLGKDFDIILEARKKHIHIEYDPK